jgi:hypothetical protein
MIRYFASCEGACVKFATLQTRSRTGEKLAIEMGNYYCHHPPCVIVRALAIPYIISASVLVLLNVVCADKPQYHRLDSFNVL